ncbi:MAG: SAF domain-containing protein [Planctomycetota bacterium]
MCNAYIKKGIRCAGRHERPYNWNYGACWELAIGDGTKEVSDIITVARKKLCRSLVSKGEIRKGTTLTEDMLCLKSPGTGLLWHERDNIVGKTAKFDIPEDITLSEDDFE